MCNFLTLRGALNWRSRTLLHSVRRVVHNYFRFTDALIRKVSEFRLSKPLSSSQTHKCILNYDILFILHGIYLLFYNRKCKASYLHQHHCDNRVSCRFVFVYTALLRCQYLSTLTLFSFLLKTINNLLNYSY